MNLIFISNLIGNGELTKICRDLEIQSKMAKYLPKLKNFEIVIVCDDSGSMNAPLFGPHHTRWDELCSIVKLIVKIGIIFDSNGVDIYFLNRDSFRNVKDPKVVDQVFQIPPSGHTPLVPILDQIFVSELARPGRDKKLLVFIATDGEPTDKNGHPNLPELERLMKEKRHVDSTFVSFLVCTDDLAGVNYLNEWDKVMSNVDVTRDFHTEREKIRQCRKQNNYPCSYGDYVVKALFGAVVPELDALNE
jgi:hypothetical protein